MFSCDQLDEKLHTPYCKMELFLAEVFKNDESLAGLIDADRSEKWFLVFFNGPHMTSSVHLDFKCILSKLPFFRIFSVV